MSGREGEPAGRPGLRQPGQAVPVGADVSRWPRPSLGPEEVAAADLRARVNQHSNDHPDNDRAFPQTYAVRILTYLGSHMWLSTVL